MNKLVHFAAAGLTALWLVAPAAYADSTNGQGAGQGNGLGCGVGNTSANCSSTPTGGVGGTGGTGPCVGSTALTGCVTINGNVAVHCAMTTNSAAIHLGELADSSDLLVPATVNAGDATLTAWCNGATSTMSVKADPLLGPAGPPAGFTNRIDYIATATIGAASATGDSTTGVNGTPVSVGVFSSNIDVALSGATSSGAKLVAGAYAGSVQVTLTPGL